MDIEKWRVNKQFGLWYILAPGDEFTPFLIQDSFDEVLDVLPYCLSIRISESTRWRNG